VAGITSPINLAITLDCPLFQYRHFAEQLFQKVPLLKEMEPAQCQPPFVLVFA
jgi:hypothetical protein